MLSDFYQDQTSRLLDVLHDGSEEKYRNWLSSFLTRLDEDPEAGTQSEAALTLMHAASQLHDRLASLRASNLSLAQSNMAHAMFVTNMLHELQLPLNAILGFMDILGSAGTAGIPQDYVREIREVAKGLQRIASGIPDKMQSNEEFIQLAEIPYNVRTLLDDTVSLYIPAAHAKGLDLQALIHSSVPCELVGDPGRIRQILNNLLSNAIRYSDAGEILLEASGRVDANGDPQLFMIVSDTGCGISEECQKRMAGIFPDPVTGAAASSGFGLAAAQRLAGLMGGTLEIRSRIGDGTAIHVTLRQKPGKAGAPEILPDSGMLAGRRILVVGEGRNQHEVLQTYLSQCGILARHLETPAQALRAMNPQTADHLVMDAVLLCGDPNATAIAAFPKKLTELLPNRTVPVFLIAANSRRGDLNQAQTNGFIAYIPQPVRLAELTDSLSLAFSSLPTMPSEPHGSIITRHRVLEARHALKERVLLAEDNRINQKLVQTMLRRLGIECDIAATGREAIHALERNTYRFILMDWQMPVMDGFTASRHIRQSDKPQREIPIIGMNASPLQTESREFRESGMNEWILKPVTLVDLRRIFERYCPEPYSSAQPVIHSPVHAAPTLHEMPPVHTAPTVQEAPPLRAEPALHDAEPSMAATAARALAKDAGISEADASEILHEYLAMLPAVFARMQMQIATESWSDLQRELHTVRGSAGNVRLNALMDLFTSFEKSVKEHAYWQVPSHVAQMIDLLFMIGIRMEDASKQGGAG